MTPLAAIIFAGLTIIALALTVYAVVLAVQERQRRKYKYHRIAREEDKG